MKWPLRHRFWRIVHIAINRVAWNYTIYKARARQDIDDKHWLWRLNNWCARDYVHWMIREERQARDKANTSVDKSK